MKVAVAILLLGSNLTFTPDSLAQERAESKPQVTNRYPLYQQLFFKIAHLMGDPQGQEMNHLCSQTGFGISTHATLLPSYLVASAFDVTSIFTDLISENTSSSKKTQAEVVALQKDALRYLNDVSEVAGPSEKGPSTPNVSPRLAGAIKDEREIIRKGFEVFAAAHTDKATADRMANDFSGRVSENHLVVQILLKSGC